MIDGALNSKTNLKFDGSILDIDSFDANKETKKIAEDNKKAIHDALNQVNEELGVIKKDVSN